jgi:hypothetical protein
MVDRLKAVGILSTDLWQMTTSFQYVKIIYIVVDLVIEIYIDVFHSH